MPLLSFESGLNIRVPAPPPGVPENNTGVTEEAGICPPPGQVLRITPLVEEGQIVAQGAPVARLRDTPEVCLVAPMPGRVARIDLNPGHKLSSIVLFREKDGDVHRHETADAGTAQGLRVLMQNAGVWPWIGRRPFGGMPRANERPAAIVVMAADTRPLAPDPRRALLGREDAFTRGLEALSLLTDGTVFVCAQAGRELFAPGIGGGRVRTVHCATRHPQASAGIRIHDLAPATSDTPVWDIHAEDVANLGALLATGVLPMTRLVSVGGAAMRAGRLVWAQPGADLRGLTYRFVKPGPHVLLSGSALEGRQAHWLAPRDRQATAVPRRAPGPRPHWLTAALTRPDRPRPMIPSAALDQAFGHALPAAAFVRALGSGDEETAIRLGALSLLEEDVALADYVLGGDARLAPLLRGILERIRAELAE